MKLEKLENSMVSFELKMEGTEYKELRNSIIDKFKNVKVDGFRKGHVPMDVIEKTFEKEINEEILNEVLKKEYFELIQSEKIKPIHELQIKNLQINKDFIEIKAEVAVFPEFELPQYKGLNIELDKVEVSDEEVNHELEHMLENSKTFEKNDDKVAEMGDVAIIDFEGFVDGVAFEGGKAENYRLELGSKSFIDTFEEQIVSHKVGDEFDVNVKFPEQYHAENLKGKDAVFKIKLNSIEVAKKAELNDEFAKKYGSENLEELKNNIKGRILESKENNAKTEKLNKIIKSLLDSVSFEIPEVLVENQIQDQIHMFEHRLQSQGMNLNSYLEMTGMTIEKMREDVREKSTEGVKVSLIMSKLAEVENIKISKKEIENHLETMATMNGMDLNTLIEFLDKQKQTQEFYNRTHIQLLNMKLNELLLENN